MTKRIQSKYKIDRRMGENLWGRSRSPLARKSEIGGPGQHGLRRKKPTDYGIQLMAKQKLKGYYGNITEKQFRRIFGEAVRRKGDTSENLIGLLEARLDITVYRMKFVPTVFAARQFVNHGHVRVNGKRVTVPSITLKVGDILMLTEKGKSMAATIAAGESTDREVPDYLEADHKNGAGKVLRVPKLADVPYPVKMEPAQVIGFYSR
ncbi:MAG: 30S ribosomal protein S4 [Alphaproteobacteria bacterium]|nr:30S ribosomal protein S4 [Alphaproteobacteria bacterium]